METLGRYTLIRKIGSGGMAEVFLAQARGAEGTEKLLVLKKIHPVLARNQRFIEMFVDEARVAMRLNHTNIVQVYAFERIDDVYVLSMEYVDGPDLKELEIAARRRGWRFPPGLAAYIAMEASKGLDYAHGRRDDRGEPLDIVHRDVSPQNILLSRQGAVKITDFGIARARSLHDAADGSLQGKIGYMSPEQAARMPVDRRSDIYALGVVLHEMLTGRPFVDQWPAGSAAVPAAIRSPRDIDPSVPADLDVIVRRAMAADPAARFQTARDMAQALALFLHSLPEIHDAAALESWIASLMPVSPPVETPPTARPTTARTATGSRGPDTVRERVLGEVERRSAILVATRVEIGDRPERDVARARAEFARLIGEMAYKAEAVAEQTTNGFRVYLGLVLSSMEDAIHGLRLAGDMLEMSQSLARDHRVDIRMAIAVSRGRVRCRRELSDGSLVYAPEPELLATSEELLAAARPGEIVAGGGVFRLARREFNFEEPRTIDVRVSAEGPEAERTARVRVHKLIGARSRAERARAGTCGGTFFDRDEEIARLDGALRRALGGRPVFFRLIGEMGIGKSRLVSHHLCRLPPGLVDVVETECLYAERDQPLSSAVAVIRALLGLPEGEAPNALRQALDDLLSGVPRYAMRQERFFRDVLASPAEIWCGREPEGQRDLVRRTAFGLGVILTLKARIRPLVLVVDNAHWLDPQSVDVLSELSRIRSSLPVLVLLVGQPSTLSGRHISGLETLELGELPEAAMRRIVGERLSGSHELEELADRVVARAQGNPFFASEIIDSLVERGVIAAGAAGERIPMDGPDAIRLPTTMDGLAAARIDALPQSQRTVLRVASAVGGSFTHQTLSRLVGSDVSEDLQALVDENLIVEMPSRPGAEPSYRFRRPMDREVAYGGLSAQDARRIHRAMADELIRRAEAGEGTLDLGIAWHLERCGETERAGAHYAKAGEAAMAIYSSREALRMYDRAIPLLAEGSADRFRAVLRREQILRGLGRHAEREGDVAALERMARELRDGSLAAQAANRRAQLRYDMGDFPGAAQALTAALELGLHAGDGAAQAESLRLLAYVASEEGHLVRALDCCSRGLSILPVGPEHDVLRGRLENSRGHVLTALGHLDEAPTALAEALSTMRRAGDRAGESLALSNLAILAHDRGELAEAVELFELALRIDGQIRDLSVRARKLADLAAILADIGDFAAAEERLDESLAACRDTPDPVAEIRARLTLADLALARGDAAAARAILEDVGREPIVSRSRLLLVRHRQLACLALVRTGSPVAARRAADEATRVALAAGMSGETVHGGVLQGLALAEAGLYGEALAATRRATDLLADIGRVRRADLVWWIQALTLDIASARPRAEKAVAEARREVERKRALIGSARWRALYDAHPLVQAILAGLPTGSRRPA